MPGNNPIEKYKAEKDGMDVLDEIHEIAARGCEHVSPGDAERLKWIGTFLRKRTPGLFMIRVRMTGGRATAGQLRALADIAERLGNGILDITTRQQIELRAIKMESVPEILKALEGVDLNSLQTGMDNIRNVNTCSLAGLTPMELLDAYPVTVEFTSIFLKNKAFTNLPRKFNPTITGCLENCTHAESQDLALVPAVKRTGGGIKKGFNVLVGGKMGSGGFYVAKPLDVFVEPEHAARLCAEIVLLYRDHGPREARVRCRLSFLLDEWGVVKFRDELEKRWQMSSGEPFLTQGEDQRILGSENDHLGVQPQKRSCFFSVGLCVPVGRVTFKQIRELARLSETYGTREVRLTQQQNAVLVNVPEEKLNALLTEPLLSHLSPNPSFLFRGLVSCTGIDYCNLAVIETKGISMQVTEELEKRLGKEFMEKISIRWSGCPAGCGNHHSADIGLQGIKANVEGNVVDAVHIFVGGKTGKDARPGEKIMELVPVDMLPDVLELVIKNLNVLRKVRRDLEAEKRVIMVPVEAAA